MSILTIPDAGLQLESSEGSNLPMQAFGITLSNSVIEDMIRCVQDGQKIELSLGTNPAFSYASKVRRIEQTPESFDYDLYLTRPNELGSKSPKGRRLPNSTMSLWKKPKNSHAKSSQSTAKAARANSSASESDLEIVHSSSGRANGQKGSQKTSSDAKRGGKGKLLPPGRSAMATALSGGMNRSLPTSPALTGAASPSYNPAYSASQQLLEKNKEQRSTIVHELAVHDQSYEYLANKWSGSDADLKTALEKVADLDKPSQKWCMKKIYWKELDVWSYSYSSQEDRQSAIDNAIRQYDKMRLGTSDAQWDRLLPKEERGKGKILSKLQATLAKGNINPTPKVSVSKPEEGGRTDDAEDKPKAEAMARSSSQTSVTKPKKPSDREAQAKRLLTANPKKPAPPKKTAASKVKNVETKGGKRILSEEFVYDSDDSDEVPLAAGQPKPAIERVAERLASKATEKPKEIPAADPAPKPKPKAKPVGRPTQPPPAKAPAPISQKRARDDDESSSSSGTPLSKRLKPKEGGAKPLPPSTSLKHRPSDASQNSRNGSSNVSGKSKNTSPAKSSPLASSPPTNASDMDEHTHSRDHSYNSHSQGHNHRHTNGVTNNSESLKRREQEQPTHHPTAKKPRLSQEVLNKAHRFQRFYERYEALHHSILKKQDPSEDEIENLIEMRQRLAHIKSEIASSVAASA